MSAHDGLKKVYFGLNGVGIAVTLFIALLVGADVFGRYVLNKPVTGTLDIVQYAIILIFFPGLAYVQANHWNIRVELVYNRFPFKVRVAIEALTLLMGSVFFGLIVWQSVRGAIESNRIGLVSDILLIPSAPFRIVIATGAFFATLEFLIQLIKLLRHPTHLEESTGVTSQSE